jgi:hypothetical protein
MLFVGDAAAWTTPDEAAAQLREKPGVRIGESPGRPRLNERFYTSVTLKRDWAVEPKDWLQIASLAREIEGTPYVNGKRHPLSISVDGPIAADALAKCFENLGPSKDSPFDLFLFEAPLNRESLLVLGSYPGLTGLCANQAADDITDEDWAKCISAWPSATNLFIHSSGGRKAIAAASKLEHLRMLKFRNSGITEADLAPLRKNMHLEVLWVFDGSAYIEYLNQKGTGKWQVENAGDAN